MRDSRYSRDATLLGAAYEGSDYGQVLPSPGIGEG